MKNILFAFLLFLTFNSFGQSQLKIGASFPDSLSVLNSCKWELSDKPFIDTDGTNYQVFLDLDKNQSFMIFRKREKFVQVWIK